ncbi:MAG: 16S rRNA (guanine(527)-N(7))-methyltransferase RsmG [Spirochaetota bacterium]
MKAKPVLGEGDRVKLLEGGLKALGIKPSPEMLSSFGKFLDELLIWNRKTNLVGTSDENDIIIRHILDSLTVYSLLKNIGGTIIDVGAGAGFPSIPLSIVDPSLRITAVERRSKRVAFLENVSTILRLKNYRVIGRDVEEVGERFDVVLFRGFGELKSLYLLSKKILKETGMIIAFKGKIKEINKEMERLKSQLKDTSVKFRVQKVKTPYLEEEERNIVIIET